MQASTSRTLFLAVIAMALGCSDRAATPTGLSADLVSAGGRQSFGFNGTASGFPTGVVFLTGGGSFVAASASDRVPSQTEVVSSGGFRCIKGVEQVPLLGCADGEGVRWDTVQLLASTTFKCTATDIPRTAVTGPGTVVLLADFYRAGDGNVESFTARMIVSASDLASGASGINGEQNLWIQGVGCGTAVVHFSK